MPFLTGTSSAAPVDAAAAPSAAGSVTTQPDLTESARRTKLARRAPARPGAPRRAPAAQRLPGQPATPVTNEATTQPSIAAAGTPSDGTTTDGSTANSTTTDGSATSTGTTSTGTGATSTDGTTTASTGGTGTPARASTSTGSSSGALPSGTSATAGSTGSGTPQPSAPATSSGTADRTTSGAGSALAGLSFYGPNAGAAWAAAHPQGLSSADAAVLGDLAGVPTATWLGAWSGDVEQAVARVFTAARATGGVPVFVAYNVPDRDCGGYSAGGQQSAGGYGQWIQDIADGIGGADAVVVVEPDALAQLCGDPAARYAMLHSAVDVLERNPGTHTYLDAGHSNWVDAPTMAERLRSAGVADADGFTLNVSNYETTTDNVAYGRTISAALGGAHFVVDTSRNGNGPGSDWCNPSGRAIGQRPTTQTGQASVDAYLWVKTPGESAGTCNGGPSAGTFWPQYAVALVQGR